MYNQYCNNKQIIDPFDKNSVWNKVNENEIVDVFKSFQFDLQPDNIVLTNGGGGSWGGGGKGNGVFYVGKGDTTETYELTGLLQNKKLDGWENWLNWANAIQPDYRFLAINDQNAQTTVFANVDDPWMFTQYIFKGVGTVPVLQINNNDYIQCLSYAKRCQEKSYVVIEPALYNWKDLLPHNAVAIAQDYRINQSIKPHSSNESLSSSSEINSTISDIYNPLGEGTLYDSYVFKVGDRGWFDVLLKDVPQQDKQLFIDRFYENNVYNTGADGAKLYKATINVQSVKWGQHGNIPPGVLDMSAPADWIETSNQSVAVPVYTAKMGVPLYASHEGELEIDSAADNYYISQITYQTETDSSDDSSTSATSGSSDNTIDVNKQFPYTLGETHLQKKPVYTRYNYKGIGSALAHEKDSIKVVKKISSDRLSGDLIYPNGCRYWIKSRDGYAKCGYTGSDKNVVIPDCELCTQGGSDCPKFSKNPDNIALAYYQATANDQIGLDKMIQQRQTLAEATASTDSLSNYLIPQPAKYTEFTRTNFYNINSDITYDVTYEYRQMAQDPVVFKKQGKQYNKGAIVKRGTGRFAIDSEQNAKILQVDSVFFGDASQINYHRWMSNIMPCYNSKFCNKNTGQHHIQKYKIGTNCGIQYKTLKGEQNVVTKQNPYCTFYSNPNSKNAGCPYNSINKNAYEFLYTNNWMFKKFNSLLNTFCGQFTNNESEYKNKNYSSNFYLKQQSGSSFGIDGYGYTIFSVNFKTRYTVKKQNSGEEDKGQVVKVFKNKDIAVVKLNQDYGLQTQVLQNQLYVQDGDLEYFTLFKVRYKTQLGDIIYPSDCQMFTLYQTYNIGDINSDGNVTSSVSKLDLWCFRVQEQKIPEKDPFTVTNEIKFLGGYHPQYKNISMRKSQFLYKKEQLLENTFMAGDYGIGDSQYDKIQNTKLCQYGYWIDENGQWIIDGRSIGDIQGESYDQIFDKIKSSKNSRLNPSSGPLGSYGLTNKMTNTFIDPQAQITQQPQPIRCTIYSIDTAQTVEDLYNDPPIFYKEQQQIPVYPHISCVQALPRQRSGAYCSVCKQTFALRFSGTGAYTQKHPFQFGKNSENKTTRLCPWCGNQITIISQLSHFPRTKAIGNVSVYGLPGTVVRTDSYFWKSPTIVSNYLLEQLKFRAETFKIQGNVGSSKTKNIFNYNYLDLAKQGELGYYKMGMPYLLLWKAAGKQLLNKTATVKNLDGSLAKKTIMSNPIISKDLWVGSETDNRYVNPLKKASIGENPMSGVEPFKDQTGLKMVTASHIRQFRNVFQPMMGYYVGLDYQAGIDYKKYRASFNDRSNVSYHKNWMKQRCTVPTIIQAYSDIKAIVEYYSGDPGIGNVREYYPPSSQWWFKQQVIGVRKSKYKGSFVHFDNYQGNAGKTASQALICLHGYVPLDKQVVAAYAVIPYSNMDVTKYPIGQTYAPGSIKFNHYHAYTTSHEDLIWDPYFGMRGHLHGSNSFPDRPYYLYQWDRTLDPPAINSQLIWKNNDNDFILNEYGFPIYVKKRPTVQPQDIFQFGWMQQNIKRVPLLQTFNSSEMMSGINCYVDVDYGKEDVWGYVSWGGFGTDIVYEKTENQIWKTMTTQQLHDMQDKFLNTFTFTVSSETNETQATGQLYYKNYLPFLNGQLQNVPNYFDFNQLGAEIQYPTKIQQVKKDERQFNWENSSDIVISQASHSKQIADATEASKVIDVTKQVTQAYNKRIEREYNTTETMSKYTLSQLYKMDYKKQYKEYSGNNDEWKKQIASGILYAPMQNNCKILNCPNPYPQLTSQNQLPKKNFGERYQINRTVTYWTNLQPPFIVDSDKSITASGQDKQGNSISFAITIPKNTYEDIQTFAQLFRKSDLSKYASINTTDKHMQITCNSMITLTCSDNNFKILGSIQNQQNLYIGNRIVSYTDYNGTDHPLKAMYYAETADNKKKWWTTVSSQNTKQQLIIDLMQYPVQEERRHWRTQAGSADYSTAYCPNQQCRCHTMMVGIHQRQFGEDVSHNNPYCPACGASLQNATGVTHKNSDGIDTFIYSKIFDKVIVKDVNFVALGKYSYMQISDDLQNWGVLNNINYESDSSFQSFLGIGRYLKIAVIPERKKITLSLKIIEKEKDHLTISYNQPNTEDYGIITLQKGQLDNTYLDIVFGDETKILVESNTSNTIYFKHDVENIQQLIMDDTLLINVYRYVTQVGGIKVYGCGYSEDDIKIIHGAKHYCYPFDQRIKLGVIPTQFLNVQAQTRGGNIIILQQQIKRPYIFNNNYSQPSQSSTSNSSISIDTDFTWSLRQHYYTVESESSASGSSESSYKYYSIKSGKFYHDVLSNSVYFPQYGYCQEDGEIVQIKNITLNLQDLSEKSLFLSQLLMSINMQIWQGNCGVQLDISAIDTGPSYQVERGTVCKILNPQVLPDNGKSTPLADLTISYNNQNAFNNALKPRKIPWICTNNQLITLNETVKARNNNQFLRLNLRGNQRVAYSRQSFIEDMLGEHGEKLSGRCQGKIILYGKPNSVLPKEKLRVSAPAVTKRKISNDKYFYQRTGGLSQGAVVVSVDIENPQADRVTQAWGKPHLVVYLKQRDPSFKIEDSGQIYQIPTIDVE